MVMLFVLYAGITYSQEKAPLKTYEFNISLNHLKTQDQADKIVAKMQQVKGVRQCSLQLVDYQLVFKCTNEDMNKYQIIDIMKQILTEEGAEVVTINRETLIENE
jgi:hypothetical protein